MPWVIRCRFDATSRGKIDITLRDHPLFRLVSKCLLALLASEGVVLGGGRRRRIST